MDRKTLEYLESRAKQGRALLNRIEKLNWMKKRVEYEHLVVVYARTDGEHGAEYRFGAHTGKESSDPWESKTQRLMIGTLIQEIDAEIARLEQKLAEL
jgi:hypothetical protein